MNADVCINLREHTYQVFFAEMRKIMGDDQAANFLEIYLQGVNEIIACEKYFHKNDIERAKSYCDSSALKIEESIQEYMKLKKPLAFLKRPTISRNVNLEAQIEFISKYPKQSVEIVKEKLNTGNESDYIRHISQQWDQIYNIYEYQVKSFRFKDMMWNIYNEILTRLIRIQIIRKSRNRGMVQASPLKSICLETISVAFVTGLLLLIIDSNDVNILINDSMIPNVLQNLTGFTGTVAAIIVENLCYMPVTIE